jgi:hypothetical protein
MDREIIPAAVERRHGVSVEIVQRMQGDVVQRQGLSSIPHDRVPGKLPQVHGGTRAEHIVGGRKQFLVTDTARRAVVPGSSWNAGIVKFPVGEVARSCAAADPVSRLVMRAQAIGAAAVCRTNCFWCCMGNLLLLKGSQGTDGQAGYGLARGTEMPIGRSAP